jgi:hypothetical protein
LDFSHRARHESGGSNRVGRRVNFRRPVDFDAPAQDLAANETAVGHFNAAVTMAQAALAALNGNAPFARVVANGYLDLKHFIRSNTH